MSKLTPSQGLGMYLLTVLILYILGSIFSLSITMEDWNWFSKILFWGPTIVMGVWTVNDYFINPSN